MFDLTNTNTDVQTMTSREIADLVESRHDSVKRTVERLMDKGIVTVTPLVETSFKDSLGKTQFSKVYNIGKRDSYIVVAQLCPEFTARLVDRWQELEEKVQQPTINLNDPAQLRGLLSNYAERVIALQEKVEEAAPKVEFVDNYVEATGLLGFREVAKLLNVKESFLRDWLISKSIIYRLSSNWAFSHYWLNNVKRGVHKVVHVNGKARTSIKFTPKGFAYIAERISK